MTPEQIAEAGQRLARLATVLSEMVLPEDVQALALAQQALREWVPREGGPMSTETLDAATLRAVLKQFEDKAPHELAEWLDEQIASTKLEDTPDV